MRNWMRRASARSALRCSTARCAAYRVDDASKLHKQAVASRLYNPSATYSFNSAPDFIFKAAAEPGFGHFEVFGVVRRFRDRIYPNETAATHSVAGASNFSTTTGGVGANARISLFKKHVDVAGHFLGGDGMGRYGTST